MNIADRPSIASSAFRETVDTLMSADSDEDKASACLSEFITALGFDRFSYALAPTAGYDGRSGIILTDYAGRWLSRYTSNQYHHSDPMLGEISNHLAPFPWGGRAYLRRQSKPRRIVILEALEFGIAEGFTIPLRGPRGELGALSGVYADSSVAGPASWKPGYEWMSAIATYVHAYAMIRIGREAAHGEPVVLSDHERACLRWTLKGKTSWEIAQIVGRSRPTVEYHLQKAMRKLNASNKAHAAAIALARGLM